MQRHRSSFASFEAASSPTHSITYLFAPGHLSVIMYSTMLQSLIMLRVAFVKMRDGESQAQ
jgi:hypothetical protein